MKFDQLKFGNSFETQKLPDSGTEFHRYASAHVRSNYRVMRTICHIPSTCVSFHPNAPKNDHSDDQSM